MRARDNNGEEDEREIAEIGKLDRQRGVRGRAQRGGGREGKCKKNEYIFMFTDRKVAVFSISSLLQCEWEIPMQKREGEE